MRRNLAFALCMFIVLLLIGCQHSEPVAPLPVATDISAPSLSGGVPPPEPYMFGLRRICTAHASNETLLRVPITVDQYVNTIGLGIDICVEWWRYGTGASVDSCYFEGRTETFSLTRTCNDHSGTNTFMYQYCGSISPGNYVIRIRSSKIGYIGASAVMVKLCDPANPVDHDGYDEGTVQNYHCTTMAGDDGNILVVFSCPQYDQSISISTNGFRIAQVQPTSGFYLNTFADTLGTDYSYWINSGSSNDQFRIIWAQFQMDPALRSPGRN